MPPRPVQSRYLLLAVFVPQAQCGNIRQPTNLRNASGGCSPAIAGAHSFQKANVMNKKAEFQQGYEVTQDGNMRIISFRGDGLTWGAYIVFPIALPVFVLSLMSILPLSWWPVPVICILGFAYMVYTMFQQQSFTLTPDALIKNGVEYDLGRISEVAIDNPADKSVAISGQPSLIVGGTGAAGASVAAMGAMANAATSALVGANLAISRSAAKRRYRVLVRYGASTVKIARNLKHDRAVSIFSLLTKS
tara:strand:- start:914 stop:1657 length:744 start_codon:yes stop_codon:yes gene_type:complete